MLRSVARTLSSCGLCQRRRRRVHWFRISSFLYGVDRDLDLPRSLPDVSNPGAKWWMTVEILHDSPCWLSGVSVSLWRWSSLLRGRYTASNLVEAVVEDICTSCFIPCEQNKVPAARIRQTRRFVSGYSFARSKTRGSLQSCHLSGHHDAPCYRGKHPRYGVST